MKRYIKILIVVAMIASVLILSGCEQKTGNRITGGKDVQTFTYAWVKLGDETVVKGAITQWRDYTNGDEVQVLIGGKYYLTHYSNVVLVADPEHGTIEYSDPEWFTTGE